MFTSDCSTGRREAATSSRAASGELSPPFRRLNGLS
jgi:hypothetical protein